MSALVNIATAVPRDARAAEGEAMVQEKLRTLHAALDPRAEFGVVHGELCAEHTLVGPDGEPVTIDIEGLMYTDIKVEHCCDADVLRLALRGAPQPGP